jgi:c-di-GMP-binding flagellar brake protein YcgR
MENSDYPLLVIWAPPRLARPQRRQYARKSAECHARHLGIFCMFFSPCPTGDFL